MRLPGLDPDAEYVVEVIPGEVSGPPDRHPGWASSQVRLTGRALAVVGLPAPRLADRPGTAFLFQCLRARAAEPGLGAPGVPSAAAGGGARMRLGKPCSCSPTCATAYPHSRIAY